MDRHLFSTSPGYLQALRGLHRLHELALAGQNDSPEADTVRDDIDQYWYDLSETEQERLNGLSEDLYTISDPTQEPLPSNPQVNRKLTEAHEARRAGKWDQALDLLRRWSRYFDPAKLSSLRASIWHEAGDRKTAILFYEHAARLDPKHFEHSYLYNLRDLDTAAGWKLAREILAAEESHSAEIVITASCFQFEAIRRRPIAESWASIEMMISALEKALFRVRNDDLAFPSPNQKLKQNMLTNCLFLLACCHERIGDLRTAIRYLNEALEVNPDDANILMFRGLFRYGVESGAADDLKRAAELGSSLLWPGFYLAHHSLVEGRYQECLKMCELGLTSPAPDEFRANLHEWLAISRAELGYPLDQVRSAFEDAIRLSPDADHIRNNLAAFEKALANPTGPRPDWIKPKASTVQAFGRSEYLPALPPMLIAA